MTALDTFLSTSQQSLNANRDLFIASIGLGCAIWAESVAPFYRTMWDLLDLGTKLAFPRLRAADVVQFGVFRDAKIKRIERREAALRG